MVLGVLFYDSSPNSSDAKSLTESATKLAASKTQQPSFLHTFPYSKGVADMCRQA